MNLHGIVRGAIQVVNQDKPALLHRSIGYTTQDDGTQVPTYASSQRVRAQVQPLSYGDLQHTQGMNIQGEARSIYLYGDVDGVLRPEASGGDLIVIGAERWLVVQNMEQWPDWCRVAAVRQL